MRQKSVSLPGGNHDRARIRSCPPHPAHIYSNSASLPLTRCPARVYENRERQPVAIAPALGRSAPPPRVLVFAWGNSMLSSGTIDLALGIVFVFGATAAISSVATELIARFLGLRGAYLLLGLRELVDSNSTPVDLRDASDDFRNLRALMNGAPPSPIAGVATRAAAQSQTAQGQAAPNSATGALLGSPVLGNQGMPGQITTRPLKLDRTGNAKNKPAPLPKSTWKDTRSLRRSLPSYIPARSFAEAVIDLVVPDAGGQTTMNTIQYYIGQLPDSMSTLRTSLEALAANAAGDMTLFRTSVEHWYDDHMARVSGWYKRHVTIITLVVGTILVLLLNINTITIGRAFYSDSTIRSTVSAVAAKGTNCPASPSPNPSPSSSSSESQLTCLGNLEAQLTSAARAGLPLGWSVVSDCAGPDVHCNWWDQHGIFNRHGGSPWQFILVLLGFLITIAAIAPGAQFWFGLLTKLGSLRASGPPPPAAAS